MSITGFEATNFKCPTCGNSTISVNRSNGMTGCKIVYNLHCKTCGKRSAGYPENLQEWKRGVNT